MGFISGILAIIALIVLWQTPLPMLWWSILILVIVDFLCVSAVKESIRMHGNKDRVTLFWLIITTLIQIATIALSIYAFFV